MKLMYPRKRVTWIVGLLAVGVLSGALVASVGDSRSIDQYRIPSAFLPVVEAGSLSSEGTGALTVVVFCSMTCEYCKRTLSTIHQMVRQIPGGVRIVQRFVAAPTSPIDYALSKGAICADRQNRLSSFQAEAYRHPLMRATVYEVLAIAEKAGVPSLTEFTECFDDAATLRALSIDHALAEALEITSTPTFIVRGTALVGLPIAESLTEYLLKPR